MRLSANFINLEVTVTGVPKLRIPTTLLREKQRTAKRFSVRTPSIFDFNVMLFCIGLVTAYTCGITCTVYLPYVLEHHVMSLPRIQVMRKKTDPETLAVKKKIIKSSKSNNTKARQTKCSNTDAGRVTGKMTGHATAPSSPIQKGDHAGTNSRKGMGDGECETNENRGRSVTPTESDFSKYLNVHITPPDIDRLTSFEMSREEYLNGIIQLVQSDCPEVVRDMDSFMEAIRKAFK